MTTYFNYIMVDMHHSIQLRKRFIERTIDRSFARVYSCKSVLQVGQGKAREGQGKEQGYLKMGMYSNKCKYY